MSNWWRGGVRRWRRRACVSCTRVVRERGRTQGMGRRGSVGVGGSVRGGGKLTAMCSKLVYHCWCPPPLHAYTYTHSHKHISLTSTHTHTYTHTPPLAPPATRSSSATTSSATPRSRPMIGWSTHSAARRNRGKGWATGGGIPSVRARSVRLCNVIRTYKYDSV